jgi:hypothetical protein
MEISPNGMSFPLVQFIPFSQWEINMDFAGVKLKVKVSQSNLFTVTLL